MSTLDQFVAWLQTGALDSFTDRLRMSARDRTRMLLGGAMRTGEDLGPMRAVLDLDELRRLADDETEHPAARDGARRILGG